jgi:hypothetical protein
MTAYRVIEDHRELENIGSLTHDQLDSHVNKTPFVVVSGTSDPLPPNSRYLEAGSGVTIIDKGAGAGLLIAATGSGSYVFPTDLQVSLSGGKSFGRYLSGDTIPALGKTPAEVIVLAISEPIAPTISLIGANILTSAFNTTGSVDTTLTGSYTINSAGATVSSVSLQFRSGNVGPWNTLTSSPVDPINYDHVFSVGPFFSSILNYQYIVEDSAGGVATGSLNLTPQGYASPASSLNIAATSPGGITGETDLKREKGNVNSTLSGTITRQRVNVPITSYSVQYSTNNSTWTDVPGLSSVPVVGNPSSVTIPATVHYDMSLKSYSTVYYRIQVVDIYQTTNYSPTAVSFLNTIWHGPCGAPPIDSAGVRSLGSKVFTDTSNPFNLQTGTVYNNFTVAMPSTLSLTEVLDLDALNANITANYGGTTFNVTDGGGVATPYHVYTMTNAIPYTYNHRHQVKRA